MDKFLCRDALIPLISVLIGGALSFFGTWLTLEKQYSSEGERNCKELESNFIGKIALNEMKMIFQVEQLDKNLKSDPKVIFNSSKEIVISYYSYARYLSPQNRHKEYDCANNIANCKMSIAKHIEQVIRIDYVRHFKNKKKALKLTENFKKLNEKLIRYLREENVCESI